MLNEINNGKADKVTAQMAAVSEALVLMLNHF